MADLALIKKIEEVGEENALKTWIAEGKTIDLSGTKENRRYITGDLSNLKLHGANLAHCSFNETRVAGTDFTDADLTGSGFYGADCEHAKFNGAKLDGAIFTGSDLQNASFVDASLRETSFEDAVLQFCDFTGADASQAVFDGADILEGNFHRAILASASFSGAIVTRVNFEESNCASVRFADVVNIATAYFIGTKLSRKAQAVILAAVAEAMEDAD